MGLNESNLEVTGKTTLEERGGWEKNLWDAYYRAVIKKADKDHKYSNEDLANLKDKKLKDLANKLKAEKDLSLEQRRDIFIDAGKGIKDVDGRTITAETLRNSFDRVEDEKVIAQSKKDKAAAEKLSAEETANAEKAGEEYNKLKSKESEVRGQGNSNHREAEGDELQLQAEIKDEERQNHIKNAADNDEEAKIADEKNRTSMKAAPSKKKGMGLTDAPNKPAKPNKPQPEEQHQEPVKTPDVLEVSFTPSKDVKPLNNLLSLVDSMKQTEVSVEACEKFITNMEKTTKAIENLFSPSDPKTEAGSQKKEGDTTPKTDASKKNTDTTPKGDNNEKSVKDNPESK